MNNQIEQLKEKLASELASAATPAELENIRVTYLGKKGLITDLLKNMKELSPEEKKTFGQAVNALKDEATQKIFNPLLLVIMFYSYNH